MEITNLVSRILWKIEPKAEGGFIARCSDTSAAPLEGATYAEVQQKVREKISAELATKFPSLKVAFEKPEAKFINLDTKFDLALTNGADAAQTAEGGIKGAVEHWLTDNAIALAENKLPPELLEQLKAQAHQGKLNFTVTTTTRGSGGTQVRTKTISLGDGKTHVLDAGNHQASGALEPSAPVSASFTNPQLDGASPITPVSGSNSFLRFLLAAVVVLGFALLFMHLKK